MLKDLKEGLAGRRKPDTTHVRSHFRDYVARGCEYGEDKYERANYLRPTGEGPHAEPTAADVARFRNYLRACVDHASKTLDALERHQAQDPHLRDVAGLRRAAYCADTDVTPGAKVGASMLPHVAPAACSLMMGIEQAVDCGLLPADPGAAWIRGAPAGWREPTSIEALQALVTCVEEQRLRVERRYATRRACPAPAPVALTTGDERKPVEPAILEAAQRDRERFEKIEATIAAGKSEDGTVSHQYREG